MASPPPPPAPPPYAAGPAGPGGPDPLRPRPSGWWFALGGALLLAAVAAGVALVAWTLSSFVRTDATVPADGASHPVSVPTDGDRVLWFPRGAALSCRVVDTAAGEDVALRPVSGTFEKSDRGGDRVARLRFAPGSGELEVTCAAEDQRGGRPGDVQVGPAPDIGGFLGSVALTVAVPLLLGLAGLVVLLVTAVRWATGRPRRTLTCTTADM